MVKTLALNPLAVTISRPKKKKADCREHALVFFYLNSFTYFISIGNILAPKHTDFCFSRYTNREEINLSMKVNEHESKPHTKTPKKQKKEEVISVYAKTF